MVKHLLLTLAGALSMAGYHGPDGPIPAAVADTGLRVIDLTPRFLEFYEAAREEEADEPRRWELWKEMYDFAALPPVPQRDSMARAMLAEAWPRYPTLIDRIREGADGLEPGPDAVLRAVALRMGAEDPIPLDVIVFVGDGVGGAFFAPQQGRMVVALPIEEPPERRATAMVHEFTHAVHHTLAELTEGWERTIARTLFSEGLGNRMEQAFFPGRPAAAYLEHRPGWFAAAEEVGHDILRGIRPYLRESESEQVLRFTMGTGTTGLEREAYYAGWVVVGHLLDEGWTFDRLARIPEDRIPDLVETAIGELLSDRGARDGAAGDSTDPVAKQDITFMNGATRLSGHLIVPTGPGPHPAFVALMGSGDGSYRNSWREGAFPFWKDIAGFLVERGYAVMLFDKPGVSASTGDWRRQSFDDRADEAVSAVRYLSQRGDIDPARIGLVGHSQGGWIAQIAGARYPDDVAFMILLAGPSISVRHQIRDDVRNNWGCRDLSGPGLVIRRAGLGMGLGAMSLTARVVRPGYLSRIINFDPRRVLPDIRQPALAIFAEHDPLVVPEPNRKRLRRFFGTAHGNDRLAITTVQGADHFFRASELCPEASQHPSGWAPGFFAALEDLDFWLWLDGINAAHGH